MSYKDDIADKNLKMFNGFFSADKVNMIPALEDKRLSFDRAGLSFDATVLYIDIKDSSSYLNVYTPKVVARIHMNIFNTVVRIAAIYDGEVRSFNGKGLLVFFKDTGKSVINMAVQAALIMKYLLIIDENGLNKYLLSKFESSIDFGIGIDCGTVLCTKMCIGGGNNSSLVFIGNCINKTEILSKIRKYPNNIGISDAIYNNLDDKNKYKKAVLGLDSKEYMWKLDYLNYNGKNEFCYSTTYCCLL